MNDADKRELSATLANVLDDHRGVDAETHKKHHEYIDRVIRDNHESVLFWRSIRKQIFGWGIIVMLTGIGLAVADYAKHIMHIK